MKLISLKCPNCRAPIEVDENKNCYHCKYCGCEIITDNDKKSVLPNKPLNVTKETTKTIYYIDVAKLKKQGRKKFELVAIIAIGLVTLVFYIWILYPVLLQPFVSESQGKISAGYYDDYIGENYEAAEAHLKAAGFTNIELLDLNDSSLAIWKNEKVESISIAGDRSFTSKDYFEPDVKVIISYH